MSWKMSLSDFRVTACLPPPSCQSYFPTLLPAAVSNVALYASICAVIAASCLSSCAIRSVDRQGIYRLKQESKIWDCVKLFFNERFQALESFLFLSGPQRLELRQRLFLRHLRMNDRGWLSSH